MSVEVGEDMTTMQKERRPEEGSCGMVQTCQTHRATATCTFSPVFLSSLSEESSVSLIRPWRLWQQQNAPIKGFQHQGDLAKPQAATQSQSTIHPEDPIPIPQTGRHPTTTPIPLTVCAGKHAL